MTTSQIKGRLEEIIEREYKSASQKHYEKNYDRLFHRINILLDEIIEDGNR